MLKRMITPVLLIAPINLNYQIGIFKVKVKQLFLCMIVACSLLLKIHMLSLL